MPDSALQTGPKTTPARTAKVDRASAELVVEKGFAGTPIGDIAQSAGMTKAGLYHRIAAKQDTLLRILNHAMDELERTGTVRLIEEPKERLHTITEVARWKYQDFACDEDLLVHETASDAMAAISKPQK